MGKFARLDAFARVQIVALSAEGYKPLQIRKKVEKTDGKRPKARAIRDCVTRFREDPDWRGGHPGGPGRDQLIDTKLQKRIQSLVFKEHRKTPPEQCRAQPAASARPRRLRFRRRPQVESCGEELTGDAGSQGQGALSGVFQSAV